MAYRFALPRADVGNGITPADGAVLSFFDQGTSTPKIVYSDFTLTTSAGTTVTADADGLFGDIFLDVNADVSLTNKNGVQQWGPLTVYAPDSVVTKAAVTAVLNPQTSEEQTALVTPTDLYYLPGDIRRYGAIADGGVTDCTQAIIDAIAVTQLSGDPVTIHGGPDYYDVGTSITVSALTADLNIKCIGTPEIRYTGAAANYVIQITATNDNNVDIDGLWINCNTNAATGIRIDNPSTSMSTVGYCRFRRPRIDSPYLNTGQTYAASGITVIGGFSELTISDPLISDVNRDTGARTPGSIGCAGILVGFDDINAYVAKMTVTGGHIDTVTNNEATGVGDDVDCDGIIYSLPTAAANSNNHVPATFICRGTKFTDCKGRQIKTQADGYSVVRDVTYIRELEEAINNANDFDFQRGGGRIKDVVGYFNETATSGTTMGTGHIIATYGPDQLATNNQNKDGGFSMENVTIYSSISNATDTLPLFCFINNGDNTRDMVSVSIKNNSLVGGRLARFVQIDGTLTAGDANVNVSDNEADITTSLIRFVNSTGVNTHIVASGNRNYGTGSPELLELSSSGDPYLSGFNNTGFATSYVGAQDGNNDLQEIFRPKLIGGDTPGGHALATCQTITLADDTSHAFSATGTYGIGIITNNFSQATQAIFTHTANAFTEIYQDGVTSALITYGTTSDPNIDGDLNIWITGNDTINIQNRLGSERIFHFWHIGGN